MNKNGGGGDGDGDVGRDGRLLGGAKEDEQSQLSMYYELI